GNQEVERALREAVATREANQFTVPGRLDRELATNPFFRFDDPAVAAGRDPVASFTAIREAKDNF
ncbi:MAG: hydroxyacylglutathione hydrolase, partial [Deltaproteobacteria bacterium]|nr:hydroxyacylglutathione hydrolase [Deltaproteobacteria bacterium]